MNSVKHNPPKVIVTMSIRPQLADIFTRLAKENNMSRSQFIEYLTCKMLIEEGYCSTDELDISKEVEGLL